MIRSLLDVLDDAGASALRRVLAVFAVIAVAQGAGFAVLVPLLDALFVGDLPRAWAWTAALVGIFVVHHAALAYGSTAANTLSTRLVGTVLQRLGDHVARLPLGWFDAERTGPLGRLVSGGSIEIASAPTLLRPLVAAVLTPVTVMVVMFAFSWRLGLALLVGSVVVLAAARLLSVLVGRSEAAYDAANAEGSSRIVELALHQPVLRVFGRTVHGNRLVDEALNRQHETQRGIQVTGFGGMGVLLLALQVVLTVVVVLAVDQTLGGSVGPATAIALLVLAVRFVEPLVGAGELVGSARLTTAALERVVALLATEPLPEPEHPQVPEDSGVEMRDVTFAYGAGPTVLHHVSFTAPPRSLTAVVGPSGSGKSTLLQLVARFHDLPGDAGGSVRVGGHDVRDLGTENLMGSIGIVFQDVYLFEGTLRENVLMSRPGATDAELQEAAALARVDEIVQRLPRGWDTRVGEAGSTLSGGEKQRVSIARALLKDAPIVLLDEATAALDPQNEAAVQEALSALAAERTVIVIAHRLQTVVAADQILVLESGSIVERGTHAELLGRGGRYTNFWDSRTRAAGWRLTGSAVG